MIYFSDFASGSPSPAPSPGTLVFRTSTSSSASGAVPWTSESRDDLNAFDVGVSATDLVVPSGVSYVRFVGQHSGGAIGVRLLKNGAAFDGGARQANFTDSGSQNLVSAIVAVSPADAFTLDRLNSGTVQADVAWASMESFPSARFCSARRNATQAITSSVSNIAFDTSMHETESMHSAGVFTVPGDALFIQGSAHIQGSASSTLSRASRMHVAMTIGGNSDIGTMRSSVSRAGSTVNSVGGISAIIPVTGGELVRFTAAATQSQNVGANEYTWGQVEVLPDDVEFITAYMSGSHSATTSETMIPWGAELHKTQSGFHDNSTDPDRIYNPSGSGFTECRVMFCVQTTSGVTVTNVAAYINGSQVVGLPHARATESSGASGFGDWSPIAEGQYVQIGITGSSNHTLAADNQTWVCVEFR